MKEINDIKELIESLEKKVCELEAENKALRFAIVSACDSLTRQNSELSDISDSAHESSSFEPSFQAPIWTKK
jgi:predicted  nucleic acid-binding Zn-ribbon protein